MPLPVSSGAGLRLVPLAGTGDDGDRTGERCECFHGTHPGCEVSLGVAGT